MLEPFTESDWKKMVLSRSSVVGVMYTALVFSIQKHWQRNSLTLDLEKPSTAAIVSRFDGRL